MKRRKCTLCFGVGWLTDHAPHEMCPRCDGGGAVLDVPEEMLPGIHRKIMEVEP